MTDLKMQSLVWDFILLWYHKTWLRDLNDFEADRSEGLWGLGNSSEVCHRNVVCITYSSNLSEGPKSHTQTHICTQTTHLHAHIHVHTHRHVYAPTYLHTHTWKGMGGHSYKWCLSVPNDRHSWCTSPGPRCPQPNLTQIQPVYPRIH